MAALLAIAVALASVGCVGRLSRNDDEVRPDSDHPSAGQ
jgi:hypothetical protein